MAFLERARKAVVAFTGVALGYIFIALDVLSTSNLSTKDGISSAVFALLVAFGVYQVPNSP